MDVHQKFIIETDEEYGDVIILGKCTYHKQLAYDITKVKGGGSWTRDGNKVKLFGSSHDFGKAKKEDITPIIEKKLIFTNKYFFNRLDKWDYEVCND